MKTLIIDYGMGNLFSVLRAFEKSGADVSLINDPNDLKYADHLVLPGVGAFPDAMRVLSDRGWKEELDKAVLIDKIPILGICLGMQLFAEQSCEICETKGLGYIKGKVVRLVEKDKERIPHVGWNNVDIVNQSPLFKGINSGRDFYFVHSYHFVADDMENVLATTPYCGGFVSAVGNGNVFGTQFHPEKSQKSGACIIKNFIGL